MIVTNTEFKDKCSKLLEQVSKGDFEVAHSLEDELMLEVITDIADGSTDNPQELAKALLTFLQELDYPHWTA